ncbi:MAG: TIGR00282 family metallophosphoesterase [Fimbriimonadia bacterium]|nr:TIGR00282 family metallophosphoesterase [Fimbriimonadia bacterium]
MRILFLGDIVGKPGRHGVRDLLPEWKTRYAPDVVIANGENAAGGVGITPDIANELFRYGIEIITLGNHVWGKKEIYPALESDPRLLRPANYAPGVPGKGWGMFQVLDKPLAVMALAGRVFMEPADCPFRVFDALRPEIETPFLFVDFHGEATSEKMAFSLHVDGRASAVIGTHTHTQTADERILPGGTAFLSDVGMCGPYDSVIGMDPDIIVPRFLTQLPSKFEVAKSDPVVCGVLLDLDRQTGRALSIERLQHRP